MISLLVLPPGAGNADKIVVVDRVSRSINLSATAHPMVVVANPRFAQRTSRLNQLVLLGWVSRKTNGILAGKSG